MITRLDANQHVKRFSNMTLVEQQAYLGDVQRWSGQSAPLLLRRMGEPGTRFMTAIQCSVGWSDAECRAWMDGVRLMSAFAATDPMFQAAYTDSAKETIRWMVEDLRKAVALYSRGLNVQDNLNGPAAEPIQHAEPVEPAEKKKRGRPRKEDKIVNGQSSTVNDQWSMVNVSAPPRPKHIDQYVHLLPAKTQERAALVKDLLRQMDVARENARLLMNDPKSLPDDRARWASLATKCDKEVRSIYRELDEEWEKLVKSGKVVVDDLGNARIQPPSLTPAPSPSGDGSKEPEMVNGQSSIVNEKDPNKRRLLRKWLVDTRRGNGDTRAEHVRKWKETFAEYQTIEGDAAYEDEKIKAAAKHYGIELKAPSNSPVNGEDK